ncbi:NAD(P)H-hydrate dehydratase [Pontibacter sp. MBLB2868]|uniref:NAD(P)H-hydrate dehydratase n=1 Tax=Pontibacter sp. MBLB2868 TaxID=3451555 RepID=UPI003F750911
MKLLTAAQTREADAYTIKDQGISSVDLMERAAKAFVGWFENKFKPSEQVFILCGPGNNGGDGLAVARLLHERMYHVKVLLIGNTEKASPDFTANLQQLPNGIKQLHIQKESDLPRISEKACVIDAIFGTGLNRPVTGVYADVVQKLNKSNCTITSIDMPSGLYTDSQTPDEGAVVKADYTISFELPKQAFLLPQNEQYVGEWHVVPIGLSEQYIAEATTNLYYTTAQDIRYLLKPRKKFSHKGLYGHALLLCGGFGKIGAAVLAARACLRAGVGLLTVQAPSVGYTILQTAVPEAMTLADKHRKHLSELPEEIDSFNVIGVGPGLGTEKVTKSTIGQLLATSSHPLVIDADAINIISTSDKLKAQLSRNKIIFTPHPKEFERLIGKSNNDYDRLRDLLEFCRIYGCYVVLKGSNTVIGTPEGELHFNTTGNPGMATGGTGDVLTGIITALVAQNYTLKEACLVGVYVHGLAGDLALNSVGEISMTASDVIDHLPEAFMQLQPVS